MVMIGKNVKSSVIGGVVAATNGVYSAGDIDSATGAQVTGGDVSSTKSQAAAVRTLGAALGIPDTRRGRQTTRRARAARSSPAPSRTCRRRKAHASSAVSRAAGAPEAGRLRGMGRWSSVVAALALSACATAPSGDATPAAPSAAGGRAGASRPPPPPQYTTAVRPGGVVGGPRAAALANEVREALRARGDAGEPDGALAAVAAWLAGQGTGAQQTRHGARSRCARASRAWSRPRPRSGWTPAPTTSGAGRWRTSRRNLPVTRYARVRVAGRRRGGGLRPHGGRAWIRSRAASVPARPAGCAARSPRATITRAST